MKRIVNAGLISAFMCSGAPDMMKDELFDTYDSSAVAQSESALFPDTVEGVRRLLGGMLYDPIDVNLYKLLHDAAYDTANTLEDRNNILKDLATWQILNSNEFDQYNNRQKIGMMQCLVDTIQTMTGVLSDKYGDHTHASLDIYFKALNDDLLDKFGAKNCRRVRNRAYPFDFFR